MTAELGKLGCSDMSCSRANLLRGVIGYGSDPAQITSPVKRTPLPEDPADDGFHRTFQPFDMLKSPTSLGGHSFQDLNAHLAQNAKLSTRQRSLRHALRTATKEYVPPEEPVLPGMCSNCCIGSIPYVFSLYSRILLVYKARLDHFCFNMHLMLLYHSCSGYQ